MLRYMLRTDRNIVPERPENVVSLKGAAAPLNPLPGGVTQPTILADRIRTERT